jgi:hypothetical protein
MVEGASITLASLTNEVLKHLSRRTNEHTNKLHLPTASSDKRG